MIPMKTSTVFKNRWMALIWAAGIIWFAYDFAGSQPQASNASDNAQASDGSLSGADANKLAAELNSF
jgi:predicted component of type VI protein secretion system